MHHHCVSLPLAHIRPCSLHMYWFWWATVCSLGGNSEYNFFPQELQCSAIFPITSILSSWKKGRYLITGKEWVQVKISLILHDIEESIQLFYLYLSAYILGLLVILTIRAVIFLFHCHRVIFLFNKLGNWNWRHLHYHS